MDTTYYTSPEIEKWVFQVSSTIMAITGCFGILSNLSVIVAYFRNTSVSEFMVYLYEVNNFFSNNIRYKFHYKLHFIIFYNVQFWIVAN